MENYNGFQMYKDQSVNTMTKGEMLITLYNEAIKRLKKAKIFCGNKNFEVFEVEVERVKQIVSYLNDTLDRKYPISASLAKLYDFISYELSRAFAGRKTDAIDEILPLLEELRDTWKEADVLSNKATVSTAYSFRGGV